MQFKQYLGLAIVVSVTISGTSIIGASHAEAASQTSAFTKLKLNRCKQVGTYEQGGEWSCKGYRGRRVRVAEGDLRYALGYGKRASKQKSMTQFLSPFNTIGETLEWRVRGGRPEATILRYFTDTGAGQRGQILVVTKVGSRQACHMGYVDARANKNANALAHQIASGARRFSCSSDEPKFLGRRGVSPF